MFCAACRLCILVAVVFGAETSPPSSSSFVDITRGAPASVACQDPLAHFTNTTLGALLHARTQRWRRLGSHPALHSWIRGRELNNTEAAPCRDELYLALCTHDIVRELGLDHQKINAEGESTQDTMSLYDYNLSPGDEALHAARLWDAPFTDHLRKRRDAIRGEGDSTAASEDEDGASVWREGNGHGVGACQLHLSFVVMVHKPQLGKITRLVKRLARHPCHTTFLHVDAHLSHDRYSLLAALASAYSNVRLTRQRMHGQWGGISLVRIELLGIMEALTANPGTDFVINLSADDYPIKNDEHIHTFLTRYRGTSFVHVQKALGRASAPLKSNQLFLECARLPVRVEAPVTVAPTLCDPSDGPRPAVCEENKGDNNRQENDTELLAYIYARVLNATERVERSQNSLLQRTGRLYSYSLGSQWWMLTNAAAHEIVSSREVASQYHLFKHLHIPDEAFFQALFLSHPPLRDSHLPNSMRFARLDKGRCTNLHRSDLPALNRSQALFARKFAGVHVLNEVDIMCLREWQRRLVAQ